VKAVQFPEVNPIDMRVTGQGKELKLTNYRYPSLQQERKGIIYFNNGYGDYCGRYAFFGELFAKAGYDFVCMDPRGFGHSDGKRAFVESE
jgi:alpha-beta hydrolase superfamily lysophospholipase